MSRLNVALTGSGDAALARLQNRRGINKADATNRGLEIFDYVDEVLADGGTILVEDAAGNVTRLKLFL